MSFSVGFIIALTNEKGNRAICHPQRMFKHRRDANEHFLNGIGLLNVLVAVLSLNDGDFRLVSLKTNKRRANSQRHTDDQTTTVKQRGP